MSNRLVISNNFIVDSKPLIVDRIENPTIEDVIETEAILYAASLNLDDSSIHEGHRVDLFIRKYLTKFGVEQ